MRVLDDVRIDVQLLKARPVGVLGVAACVAFNRGTQALCAYRFAHLLLQKHIPVLPSILTRWSQMLYGIDIDPGAEIAPGAVIYHGVGLVVGHSARIGPGVVLYQGVTIGNRASGRIMSSIRDGMPSLGKDVVVGAGAKILGPIEIGDRCVVGANAVVLDSVPADHLAVGVPARSIAQSRRAPVGPVLTSDDIDGGPRR